MESAIIKQTCATGSITKLYVGFLLTCTIHISGAFAQSENGSASLEGTVRDRNGAGVQGATVNVKNTETNLTKTATTDSNGNFSVSVLWVGTYDVTA